MRYAAADISRPKAAHESHSASVAAGKVSTTSCCALRGGDNDCDWHSDLSGLRHGRLDEVSSSVCRKRSYDRPCVHATPARLRNQEFSSIAAYRHFRTKAIERRIRTNSDFDAFHLAAVIPCLANNLRKLTFMNTGRRRRLGDCDRGANYQSRSNKCSYGPHRHFVPPVHLTEFVPLLGPTCNELDSFRPAQCVFAVRGSR